MTIQVAYQRLLAQLYDVYDKREAANIADMVVEQVTGQRKIDRIVFKDLPVSKDQEKQLEKIAEQLLTHRPIQYVLGEAWFMDMKFLVNENVLIPRPETEELVQWIADDIRKSGKSEFSLLDIGTGSGCIPIAVKKKIPGVTASGIDISNGALDVAKSNSLALKAPVNFFLMDFLNREEWNQSGKYDLIVSNPPYIMQIEKAEMRSNVLHFEPHLALFVPGEDPLLFYRKLAEFGQTHLNIQGSFYVEINEALGSAVVEIFKSSGYKNLILKKDMQGKDRMVKANL